VLFCLLLHCLCLPFLAGNNVLWHYVALKAPLPLQMQHGVGGEKGSHPFHISLFELKTLTINFHASFMMASKTSLRNIQVCNSGKKMGVRSCFCIKSNTTNRERNRDRVGMRDDEGSFFTFFCVIRFLGYHGAQTNLEDDRLGKLKVLEVKQFISEFPCSSKIFHSFLILYSTVYNVHFACSTFFIW
jgi:hypothetical protein